MEKVRIEDVEGRPGPAAVSRPLTDAVGATEMALNYYELAPGDSFAYGYHRHERQEELFVVQTGTVTFETEAGDVLVEGGEVIRFAPGEFQRGVNEGEERVVAFALGAPRDRGDTEIRRQCDDCGERTRHTIERTDDGTLARCLDCDGVTGRFE
ncbi:cupin domain-containing protein [Haloarcula salinisoli]|uniref:Cupin domain-containing protein n=1 Tax=Haloarcula salinisoli TaxID=2487746 RepID=A0A8J7YB01_9EURY|nr:cupin domain-containing protein [Halomicroarcula salinisoli]MBX0285876.1 cupin domain-containing protein [Halomicroarcula salinisoli]MBX0302630.1 cupin domain-containing protein [Halomicroarcula salinisoli]